MIYQKQPPTEYGFKDFNGNAWCDRWVDTSNWLTRDVNKSAGRIVMPDSLVQQERDRFLDQRHRHYVLCAGIARGR